MTQCTTDNTCEKEAANNQNNERCTIAEDLFCLAKSAKQELLKEKMKKNLEAKIGKKLDKIAEVAVDAVLACLQQKMAEKQACEQYKENLMAAFKS